MTEHPESIVDDATWWADHKDRFWKAMFRLRDYTRERGPIQLEDGRLVGQFADGYEWDDAAVAMTFPDLVARTTATIGGSKADVERCLSLLVEEVPTVEIQAIAYDLRRDAVTGVLRAGGEAAERLEALRKEKTKLGVR